MINTIKGFFSILLLSISTSIVNAQIEGDSLFATDQVVTIELNFSQTNFFDSLVANYATESYMKADLTLTTLEGSRSFTDIGVRVKGNSTYNHPNNKKSIKIDFNRYNDDLNFDGIKKLNFNNGFKDPSCMREKIFFDLCKDLEVLAPRANFANVYFNGTLWGFYTMVEQIDDQFLDWAILDDDGNLFKAGANFGTSNTPADLVYYGSSATDYTDRYELKTNEVANDWTNLIELMDFINNSTDAEFENEFGNYFNIDEYIRTVALDNLFSNMDSYTGSARNYYLYHNLTTNKWEWIKWDANEAFGSYPAQGQNALTMDIDYHENDRPLIERLFDTPRFLADYKSEMCFLTENYFTSAYLDPKIDAYYSLIQSSVYADNNKMYSNAEFDQIIDNNLSGGGGGPGGGTTYGLKPFIADRNSSVRSQIDCMIYNSIEEEILLSMNFYPNPTKDILSIELGETSNEQTNIEIYDLSGKIILRDNLSAGNTFKQISLSHLKAGFYILKATIGLDSIEHKIIVK